MALRELCLREGGWVVPVPAAVPLAARVFGDPAAPFSRAVHAQLEALGRLLPAAAVRLAGWSEAPTETP
jgi:thioesterase domain-containing protein